MDGLEGLRKHLWWKVSIECACSQLNHVEQKKVRTREQLSSTELNIGVFKFCSQLMILLLEAYGAGSALGTQGEVTHR